MKLLNRSILVAGLMIAASIAGMATRPPSVDPNAAPRFLLEQIVPKQFGTWRELPDLSVQVVNPQAKELLNKLYSQVLTRTYANENGYRIMLSMAYGGDQRGGLQAHMPEVCYPAQGFTLSGNEQTQLKTPYGAIAARRLNTSLGPRKEPITYWFTVGDTVIKDKFQQRLIEIKLGLAGQVPDGLLVRISSIDDTPNHAYPIHDAFATDLLAAMPAADRSRLSGLAANETP